MGGEIRRKFLDSVFQQCGKGHLPRIFVETGTYRGDLTVDVCNQFGRVHTIELSPKWHTYSADRLKEYHHVTCHLGDSGVLLTQLAANISEPAVFFLDAHFSGGETALGKEEVPLLRELSALSIRSQKDLVIIDDLRLVGRKGVAGRLGTLKYPPMAFDWSHLSVELIKELFAGRGRVFFQERDDRIVAFTNLSLLDSIRIRTRVRRLDGTAKLKHRAGILATLVRTQPPSQWFPALVSLWRKKNSARHLPH